MTLREIFEVEVPEAWDLGQIRRAVQATRDGTDLETATGVTRRHVGYHLQAARILGWLEKRDHAHHLTDAGQALLETPSGSVEERQLMRRSIESSRIVTEVMPTLFQGGDIDSIADVLQRHPHTKLAATTARKRASTLLKWRDQVTVKDDDGDEKGKSMPERCDRLLLVHLSDIHFQDGTKDNPVLARLDLLVAAVAARPEVGTGIDQCCVVVSGDVAWSGRADEYVVAHKALARVCSELATRIHVQPRVLIVPGNHDCNFEGESTVRETLLANVAPGKVDAAYVNQCTEVQAAFTRFALQWHAQADRSIDKHAALELHDIHFDGRAIRFQLFNTAWMSSLHERQGNLVFPTCTLKQFVSPPRPAPDVVISVFHHPYSWLESNNARDFRLAIEQSSDIILTGHEHAADRYTKGRLPGDQSEFLEGGVLQDKDDPKESSFHALLLDLGRQEQATFTLSWNNDLYELSHTHPTAPFQRNQSRLRNEFQINKEYARLLEDPGQPYAHPRKANVQLSDIYVYPELSEAELHRHNSDAERFAGDALTFLLKKQQALVLGGELSGKTSLAKKLFLDLHRRGHVPIILSGKDLTDGDGVALHGKINEAFSHAFSPSLLEKYRQLRSSQRAIIIDDLHKSPVNLVEKDKILKTSCSFSDVVFVLASDELELEALSVLPKDAQLWEFSHCRILEFGFQRRYELVRRWCMLGAAPDEKIETLSRDTQRKDDTITRLIGQNFLPSWPAIILLCLQNLELQKHHNKDMGSFGHLYEALLIQRLYQAASKTAPIDLDAKQQFLSELAFHFYSTGERSADDDAFEAHYRSYCEKFHVSYPSAKLVNELLVSGIVRRHHGRIAFGFKYAYYFFVAKYLRDHLDEEPIHEIIQYLAQRLHHDESANIVLFLCHLTKHPFVIDTLLSTAAMLFPDVPLLDLEHTLKPLGAPSAHLVLELDGGDHEDHRRLDRERKDRIDRTENGAPDEALPPELVQYTAAIKTVQILGQILRGFPGSIPGDRKLRIAEECYSLGTRSAQALVSIFVEHRDELTSLFADIVTGRRPGLASKPVELRRIADRLLFGLCEAICFGSVVHISDALGHQTLSRTYDELLKGATDRVAYRLIDISIRLDHFDGFPDKELKKLHADVHDKLVPMSLLRRLVWRHLYLFPVPYKLRDSLCAKLDIKVTPALADPRRKKQHPAKKKSKTKGKKRAEGA